MIWCLPSVINKDNRERENHSRPAIDSWRSFCRRSLYPDDWWATFSRLKPATLSSQELIAASRFYSISGQILVRIACANRRSPAGSRCQGGRRKVHKGHRPARSEKVASDLFGAHRKWITPKQVIRQEGDQRVGVVRAQIAKLALQPRWARVSSPSTLQRIRYQCKFPGWQKCRENRAPTPNARTDRRCTTERYRKNLKQRQRTASFQGLSNDP